MLQRPEEFRSLYTVRDGQQAVVTCSTCGCRLQRDAADDTVWRHFGALGGRDAMSHRTACAEMPHDAFGRVAVLA
ncbi:MAG: hypothetical protein HY264_06040 [Chloroflexi bacterium]|nr:hypothetical protein [Chloroflexota bacterium]